VRWLGRRRNRPFVDEPGECAVCSAELRAGSPAALKSSGWIVADDQGLCPSCQEDGWQMPAGASLPIRTIPPRS
jgi:hypothetical protein